MIAALGASAGGLEALEKFFWHMPPDAGIGFVVVQHLAPDHPSVLSELLARCTDMEVEEASDGVPVFPNRVYIIPPNATLTIQDGRLRVTPPATPRGARMQIDALFSSLAQDCGENAVCIVLSGTGSDGTLGLRAIKVAGGVAMAQTAESARYDAIPRSAISTGQVDYILPVEQMPAKLIEYASSLNASNGHPGREEMNEVQRAKIHDLLSRRAGHDFREYKENTVTRRLHRRMKALHVESVEQYINVMEQEPKEADHLFNDLLIGVTRFFRDPEAFAALEHEVVPKLFDGKEPESQVRVCVVGCASGEEAYSVAILLSEYASSLHRPPQIKVFATDIDERGLDFARKGRYPESVAEDLSEERLLRFFEKKDRAYEVKRELRELCLFTSHSFIRDPPFSRLDLVSCRNVMIYLGTGLQQTGVALFHYALRAGGYLFLGPAEDVSSHRHLFKTIDPRHRIFQRKTTSPLPVTSFPIADFVAPRSDGTRFSAMDPAAFPRQLERIILRDYSEACVVVGEDGEAVYFSGMIGNYLHPALGSPNCNVISMAPEELRIPLRNTLYKAARSRERAIQKGIMIRTDAGVRTTDLTVTPLLELPNSNLFMIVFEESVSVASGAAEASGLNTSSEDTIRHLENELRAMHEHAQAMFEELESSNEELKSAIEEYQSTNEELETSREEYLSTNEELETTNSELNRRITELDHANSDLRNFNSSTQIATLFLDMEFRIRSFTPTAARAFRLIPGDIGRPVTDLSAHFSEGDLIVEIQDVIRTLVPSEREVRGAKGLRYLTRILPYRTVHDVIDGVVITFTDVTQLKAAEETARDAKSYAESIVDTVRQPLLVLDSDLRIQSANNSFYSTFHVSETQTANQLLYETMNNQWDIPDLLTLIMEVLSGKTSVEDVILELEVPGLGRRALQFNAREIPQLTHTRRLILLSIEDITERKLHERRRLDLQAQELTLASQKALREKNAELARTARALTMGELTTSIAHEINQPLSGVITNAEAGLRWLESGDPDVHEARESLKLIVRDGNRASAVTRRIREFVKKEASEPMALDLRELVRETVALTAAELQKLDISVKLDLSSVIPVVQGDKVLLQQVILNLITNACEAMASVTDRTRELLVRTQSLDNAVLVTVRDSGIGIDPQVLDKICNAFFTTKPTGMGLGLSISQSIIETLGGRIWATRDALPGLTVQFSLPAEMKSGHDF